MHIILTKIAKVQYAIPESDREDESEYTGCIKKSRQF